MRNLSIRDRSRSVAISVAVIPFIGMIEDPRQQLEMRAPMTTVKCIIGDQHLDVGGAGQRLKLLADQRGTQQQGNSATEEISANGYGPS